ncbi:MAG: hypothetical protein JW925_05600 [Syntrophaceae bacterium]|nr:hypothetical protein [Syntrophaceae bacterium]
MEWYFGYNCRHYLPTLDRCRILIDKYRQREDLTAKKLFNIEDVMVYLNLTCIDLINQVKSKEIIVKRQKDGKLMYQVLSSWQWDDCPSKDTGGQCFYFEPHSGEKISCIADLRNIDRTRHPNMIMEESEEDLRRLENEIAHLIGGNLTFA